MGSSFEDSNLRINSRIEINILNVSVAAYFIGKTVNREPTTVNPFHQLIWRKTKIHKYL